MSNSAVPVVPTSAYQVHPNPPEEVEFHKGINEEARIKERDRRLEGKLKENQQVLLLGAASHLASHILNKFMEAVPNSHITLVDSKDPNIIFLNPVNRDYKGSPRIRMKQVSPFDWDWLAGTQNEYNIIINASMVHDAEYCHNNPIDSGYRNPMQAIEFMTALCRGSGWVSDGRLIIISSDKVYGHQPVGKPTPETAAINPIGVRACTRAAQEMIQTGIAQANGIPYMVLRVGTIHGEFTPREKATNAWCRALLMGEPIRMRGRFAKDDSPSRDWIHANDVASFVAFASLSEWDTSVKNEIYNLGGCEKHEHFLWNVAEAMKTVLHKGTETQRVDWREPGERGLRVWMDCTKVMEKMCFLPTVEFLYALVRRLPIWIAHYELNWPEGDIINLKKMLGIRDVEGARPAPGSTAHLGVQSG